MSRVLCAVEDLQFSALWKSLLDVERNYLVRIWVYYLLMYIVCIRGKYFYMGKGANLVWNYRQMPLQNAKMCFTSNWCKDSTFQRCSIKSFFMIGLCLWKLSIHSTSVIDFSNRWSCIHIVWISLQDHSCAASPSQMSNNFDGEKKGPCDTAVYSVHNAQCAILKYIYTIFMYWLLK